MTLFLRGTSLTRQAYTLFTMPASLPRWPLFLLVLSLAQIACAEFSVRIDELKFTLGHDVTIKWEGGKEPVLLQLFVQDSERHYVAESIITSNEPGDGQFEWNIPSDMKPGTYSIIASDAEREALSWPFDVREGDETVEIQPFDSEGVDEETASVSETTAPPIESTSAKRPGGLKTSTKAGIAIGAGVPGLTILVLAVICIRRHRKRSVEEEEFVEKPLYTSRYSPRLGSLTSRRPFIIPTSPISPLTPSKSPSRGILFHFPRSITPKLAMPFSWNTLLSPLTPRSPKMGTSSWGKAPTLPPNGKSLKKVHVVGPPLTELPAGDVDFEVPYRHEMATIANTPELPGSPGERFSSRGRAVRFAG